MRDLAELKINEGGKRVLRLPPSDELIASFENAFGLLFPDDLKQLLRVANGGHPERDSLGGSNGQYSVNAFYHLDSDDRGTESLWYAINHWRPILGEWAMPFANDGGGNQFFLDLSNSPHDVKLCLHDEAMRVISIAPNFGTFIDSLDYDPDFI